MLLDALNRHRGKGTQKITVEHVHGGVQPKSEDQPYGSKTTAKASQFASLALARPPLRSEDANTRDAMPVSGHAERPLPDTRKEVPGRPKGQ
jgi:hypothetical protein